jgi:hypothetical protein
MLVATALIFPRVSYAEELRPIEAQSILLNDVKGVAYYTVQADGYQLVATMAADDATTPIRFVVSLQPRQTVTISVPGEVGAPSVQIDFTRVGDQVFVATPKKVALAN